MRHFNVLAAIVVCALAPASVAAQEWDRATYERRAAECVHNLEFAEEAVNSGDTDRGLSYIQLAVAPCDSARALLMNALTSGDLSARNRETLEGDLVSQDSRWVILASRLGMCDEARQMLAETSRVVPEIPSDTMERYVQASQALLGCTAAPSDPAATPQDFPQPTQQPMTAQPVQPYPTQVPAGSYVTAGPGYSASTGTGMAGGPIDATRYGSTCRGSLPELPQFELSVPTAGQVTVQVTSSADTTLVVTGAGGTHCNDDFNGLNPAVSSWMASGTYQVFVGEYTRTGTGSPFDIRFSNETLAPMNTAPTTGYVAPTYGTAYVGPGYAPSALTGVSGGNTHASSRYGATCGGYIATNPDFLLEVTTPATVTMSVQSHDGGDTTLVVTGPGGTWCNDDFNGLNPGLTTYMSAGQYQVFVGSYNQGQYHNVNMSFSAY